MAQLDIRPALPQDTATRALEREYLAEIIGRYHGRPLAAAEIDAAVVEFAADDLIPPHGLLLVAWSGSQAAGCAGVRLGPGAVGEVVRVFVSERSRRRGVARALLSELEAHAREHGLRELRLDTRRDLTESRQLYAALGYRETEPFNAEPYAEHWFVKALPASAAAISRHGAGA